MSAADTWMPLYVADFLTDTTHLNTIQTGAYLLVLMGAWVRGGKLPNDDAQLARIARCDPVEWLSLRPILEPFFEVTNECWIQHRLLKEKEKALNRCATRQAIGKLGGRPKSETNSLTNSLTNRFSAKNLEDTHAHVGVSPSSVPVPVPDHAHIPTLQELIDLGSVIGVTEVSCRRCFDHYQGKNLWLNRHGRLIDIPHTLKTWGENDRAAGNNKPGASGQPGHKPFISELQAKLRATEDLVANHIANPSGTWARKPTEKEKEEFRDLVRRVDETKKEISAA